MPSLRGLAVSCKLVDDASLAALPRFPALRELLPIDVSDDGFRHVGACVDLEYLCCMYCRETTDAATAHVVGLPALERYYAGATQITDRSLEMLSTIATLERIELYECLHVTDAGLTFLAALPNLRELALSGLPGVTRGRRAGPAGARARRPQRVIVMSERRPPAVDGLSRTMPTVRGRSRAGGTGHILEIGDSHDRAALPVRRCSQ